VDGGIYTAGAAIEWLIRIGLLSDVAELDRLAGEPAVTRKLCFVPALAGLACPHWDRNAAGVWIGLANATGRDDLLKEVLEGIAFRVCEVLDALGTGRAQQGLLSVDGGLTRSRYFVDFFATIANRRLALPANSELTAYGAALLAGHGAIAPPREPMTMVGPRTADIATWRARFTAARERASGWRGIA
jgi:glycerol kinase